MANTSSRTLRLLSLLQSRLDWPGPELAARLGVSTRTLRRDVDRLRELGYPVQATRGVQGGYRLRAGTSLPPLALDEEEAVALAVGLQASAASAAAGVAEPSLRALGKVVQVMPARLRRRVEALRATTVMAGPASATTTFDPSVLLTLAQACHGQEGLEFGYTAADGATSRRRVQPHSLAAVGQRWYLVAYDTGRQGWRSFRIDRIAVPAPDGRRFRARDLPAPDAASYVRESISSAPAGLQVRAVLDCPAQVARSRLGRWAQVEELPEGRCRLSINTDSLDWAAFALGRAGAALSQVEPPQLLELLQDWSRRFARAGGP